MSEELIARLGPLPETHGLLGAMLERAGLVPDRRHPERPALPGLVADGHPDMRSFLGVPICAAGEVIGAFYLTDKEDAPTSSRADDQELIELLAAHAAIAVTNARLYERSRELSILDERNRLALELHDVISQKLFALALAAESADALLDVDEDAARVQIGRLRALSQEALEELRYLILELRPPELERDGLASTLRKHVEVLRRVQGGVPELELELDLDGEPPADGGRDRELLRIAQEALQNAIRHSGATRIVLRLETVDGNVVLEVRDDGTGFDPQATAVRARRLGLVVDGGAGAPARRAARRSRRRRARGRPSASRRRCDRARSACSSSTTTRSSARGSAPSCASRRGSRWSARRATAPRPSPRRSGLRPMSS